MAGAASVLAREQEAEAQGNLGAGMWRLIKEAEAKGLKRPPDDPGKGSGKGRLIRKAEAQGQERPPYRPETRRQRHSEI
jgi:hypothetical protein